MGVTISKVVKSKDKVTAGGQFKITVYVLLTTDEPISRRLAFTLGRPSGHKLT